jgi:hypothetical protein
MSLSKIRIHVGTGPDSVELSAQQAGQIIVIFALMLTVLIGLVGIAIDVTNAWRNGLQIQRAADAAAMSGVVYLPGALPAGQNKAYAIAAANGYSTAGGATVVANYAPGDTRKMDVTITAPVHTYFVSLFGVTNWTITRTARAAYVMPVPMGSPLNYMGVGCLLLASGQPTPPACNSTGTGASGVTTSGTSGGTSLGSLGAWGAVITKGGYESNGDAYSPANNNDSTWTVSTGSNVLYDQNGYYYTAVMPAGGKIQIFDPGFCENKANGGNYYGTGDHWIAGTGTGGTTYNPVSTYYRVLNTHGQPLNPLAWDTTGGVDWGAATGDSLFLAEHGTDAGAHGSGACDAYHNQWWTLDTVAAGTYEVEVSTTDPNSSATNTSTNAENMFAIMVPSGGAVYGYDKMAVYNNLSGNGVLQQFYLAKIDQTTGAGKTLTIDLFDVGDSTAGSIQILSPDGNTQTAINFNYSTFNYNTSMVRIAPGNCVNGKSDQCSDTGVGSIVVAGGGGSSFNNTWIEITIPLTTAYGSGGLWQGGWWQVQYNVSAGNDTTTWSVNVNGNPVHLVPTGG